MTKLTKTSMELILTCGDGGYVGLDGGVKGGGLSGRLDKAGNGATCSSQHVSVQSGGV